MDETPHLSLPFLQAAQAQKHVTINESLGALDTIVALAVLDRDLGAPPGSPADGDRYIVAASPTGAWSGHAEEIAVWRDGAWAFHTPQTGWRAWLADEATLAIWTGAAWNAAWAQSIQNAALVGVNAAADATNKLSVASAASLFSNVGAGHQLKVNKAAAGDTASILFQTGFSGRAEFGLTGDDNFHVKTSADGSAWHEAIVIDKSTGKIGIGAAAPDSKFTVSSNAASLPTPLTGTLLHFAQADTTSTVVTLDSFAVNANFAQRRADGTAASPSAVASGVTLGLLSFYGYGATAYSSGPRAKIEVISAEAWSDTAQGCHMRFNATAVGAASSVEALRIAAGGNIGIGLTAPACKLDVDGPARVKSYTVSGVPAASAGAGQIIYVSNESGGAVLAFSDGTNWRRVTDRAVVS